MATREQLENALRKAHSAGDTEIAQRLAAEIRGMDTKQPAIPRKPTMETGGITDVFTAPIKQMAGGLAGEVVGGAVGGARALTSGLTAGQEAREGIREKTAYQPQSVYGQIGSYLLGKQMDRMSQMGSAIPAFIAQKSEEYFGDPKLVEQTAQSVRDRGFLPTVSNRLLDEGVIGPYGAAAIQMAPEIAAGATGAGYLARGVMAGRRQIADQLRAQQQLSRQKGPIPQDIELPEGVDVQELAQYKLTPSGGIVSDDSVKPLMKKGARPEALVQLKASSSPTKRAAIKMARIKKKGIENPRYGDDNRPADVVGEALLPRFNFLKATNKKAGRDINTAANNLKGQRVNFEEPFNQFLGDLDEMGINLRQALQTPGFFEGNRKDVIGRIKELYQDSDIDLMPKFQRPLTNVIYRAGTKQGVDAFDLHKMKRYIDENVSYGKAEAGLLARVSQSLKGLRAGIDEVLDANFEDYRVANETYSETIRAIDKFQDVMPRKVDLTSRTAEAAIGQELRDLATNYGKRNPLRDSLAEIDRVAEKYSKLNNIELPALDTDLRTLSSFMHDLDEMFGETGRRTMGGIMERVGEKLTKQQKSRRERVAEWAIKQLTPEDKDAFESLERMLQESDQL